MVRLSSEMRIFHRVEEFSESFFSFVESSSSVIFWNIWWKFLQETIYMGVDQDLESTDGVNEGVNTQVIWYLTVTSGNQLISYGLIINWMNEWKNSKLGN